MIFQKRLSALALALSAVVAAPAAAQPNSDDWYLHRPSTPAERAQTRDLNREYQSPGDQAAPPQADGDYRREQWQYERELRAYRMAQDRYERELRGPRQRHGEYRQRPRRPQTAQEMDNDPFGPTGGAVDENMAAPTPGLDGSTTGLTQFNARASGLVPPRRPQPYYYPPDYYRSGGQPYYPY